MDQFNYSNLFGNNLHITILLSENKDYINRKKKRKIILIVLGKQRTYCREDMINSLKYKDIFKLS